MFLITTLGWERSGNGRKRTLSAFMEEKKAERERQRERARNSSSATTTSTENSKKRTTSHARSDTGYPFSLSTSQVFSNSTLTSNLAFRTAYTSPQQYTFSSGSGYQHYPFQRMLSFNSTSDSAADSPAPPTPSTPVRQYECCCSCWWTLHRRSTLSLLGRART